MKHETNEQIRQRYLVAAALQKAIDTYCWIYSRALLLKNERLFNLTIGCLEQALGYAWAGYYNNSYEEISFAQDMFSHLDMSNEIAIAAEANPYPVNRPRLKLV